MEFRALDMSLPKTLTLVIKMKPIQIWDHVTETIKN